MAGAFRYFSWISIQLEPVLFDGVVPVSKKILSLLPFLYFGTMLLGPVVQVRYLFPIMVMLPVLAAFFSSDRMKSQSNENREQKVVFLGRKIYNKAIG